MGRSNKSKKVLSFEYLCYILPYKRQVKVMDGYIWLALTIIFAVGEIMAPGLISIWFALAAGILTLTARFIESPLNQIYIFIALSAFFLIITRPLSKRLLSKREYKLEDRIIGQIVVVERVLEDGNYEVKLDGKYWKAICQEGLSEGSRAKVLRIEGIKLILEKE